jgi:FKBP-type peptidyl-prolyl cis-trans isomerase FklB
MTKRLLPAIIICTYAGWAFAAEPAKPNTDKEKFSYTIGHQIAQNIKRRGLDVDVKALAQAIEDELSGKPSRLSVEEMQGAMAAYQQTQMEQQMAVATKNKQAGDTFMATNKKKEPVVALPNGLQYKIIQAGKGKKPKATDTVVVHYRGTLINGEEFDSSYSRGQPATFEVGGIIEGWQQALQLMPEGAKWQVIMPPELAYGMRGAGDSIGPNETLVFEIELLEVKE